MKTTSLLFLFISLNVFAQWENVGPAKFTLEGIGQSAIESNNFGTIVSYRSNGKPVASKFNGEQWDLLGSEDITDFTISDFDMAVYEDVPYIVYNKAATPRNLYLKKFDGENWVDVSGSPFYNGNTQYLSIKLLGEIPYVVFQNTSTGKANVMRFNGTTWESVGNTEIGTGTLWNIDLQLIDSTPYISFREFLGVGQNKLNVMRLEGNTWQYVGGSVADLASNSDNTNPLVISSLTFEPVTKVPYITYAIKSPNINELSHVLITKKFESNSWIAVGEPIINVRNTFEGPRSTFFANQITVAYNGVDPNSGNVKVCVRTFNGNTWEIVGSNYFASNGIIDTENFLEDGDYDLASTADFLYLSYSEDGPVDKRLSVLKIANPLTTNNIVKQQVISVYPNPSKNIFFLETADSNLEWLIYNNLGQKILSGNGQEIDLSNQASGMYFLKIKSDQLNPQTIKLIKV